MINESLTVKVWNFCKKQCILSFVSFLILVFGSLIVFDSKINPIPISYSEAPDLIGPLSINDRLTKAEILHFRKVKGCESLVQVDGYIYSTSHDGNIVKFNDTHVEVVTRLHSNKCSNMEQCGRPLGIRYDSKNHRLLVVDAYLGLFEIDVKTEIPNKIFPKPNDNFKITFFNDFDILPNGDVIVSEASTKFSLHNFMSIIFEGRGNGRLLQISPATGQYRIIADNLFFPNGVQLHLKDPNVVLVAELMKMRILAVNIDENTTMSQRVRVFTNNLPGFPDNIRPSFRHGGYWINFVGIRHSGSTFMYDLMGSYPFLRNWVKKLLSDSIIHLLLRPNHGLVIRIDEFGHIIESLHDPHGRNVSSSSETLEIGKNLYLGSYYLPYIVKIDL